MAIRVLVGEDNYLAREGIERVLQHTDDVTHIGTCADLDTLRQAVAETHPDVVLTDIRMPPTHTDEGLRLAAELRSSHPDVGVVILSQHAEPLYARALFGGGIDGRGYLLKERLSSQEELNSALREVAAGRSYLDPGLVAPIVDQQGRHDPRLEALTARELQILSLVAEGRSNMAIADATGVTKRAVERHINSIFGKIGLVEDSDVNRRVMATRMYLAAHAVVESDP
jgi:DNA-binding NarL/FixJ family response regulator